ncbi:MAG: DNA repair protein RecO [Clostridia bacterium]|nr:DNA repair protein RecO [Clostridia bacterium]
MDEKYNAICLKKTSYKDSGEMLTLFTLERGIVNCALMGARSPKAKLRFSGETFCFAEYVLAEKADRRTVKEATQIDSFYGIREDLDRYYCAAAVIEFILNVVYAGESNYELFLATVKSLKAIEVCEKPKLALVAFYIKALNASGYMIDFSSCHNCGAEVEGRAFFDFDNSSALCKNCATQGSTEMKIDTFSLIKETSSHELDFYQKGDLSTYSPTFSDDKSIVNALKFLNYYIVVNLGVTIKTNKTLIEN